MRDFRLDIQRKMGIKSKMFEKRRLNSKLNAIVWTRLLRRLLLNKLACSIKMVNHHLSVRGLLYTAHVLFYLFDQFNQHVLRYLDNE